MPILCKFSLNKQWLKTFINLFNPHPPFHMCLVGLFPVCVSQHALQQQQQQQPPVSAGAADVGGKRVTGNRKMDRTISASAASAADTRSCTSTCLQRLRLWFLCHFSTGASSLLFVVQSGLFYSLFSPIMWL